MRCTGSLGSSFQHLGCGQQGFEILYNPRKIALSMDGRKKIFGTHMCYNLSTGNKHGRNVFLLHTNTASVANFMYFANDLQEETQKST